jgi:hypothetical protein
MTGNPDFATGAGLPYLRKPFTREQLLEIVERLLAR